MLPFSKELNQEENTQNVQKGCFPCNSMTAIGTAHLMIKNYRNAKCFKSKLREHHSWEELCTGVKKQKIHFCILTILAMRALQEIV